MKRTVIAMALCLTLVVFAMPGRAQEATGFRADLVGQIEYVQHQILDLENSVPDGKMTWRPNNDVRSISEVYSHIAFTNYLLCKFAGIALPEGLSVDSPDDATKWEKASIDKKVIREQLVKSFDFVKAGVKALPDSKLDNTVDFFGNKMTIRGVLMVVLSHLHEHLGQSIAYARMNGVVPPWTAAQMAASKQKKENK
jgi:uncharacterized damage-inducible protein DinB